MLFSIVYTFRDYLEREVDRGITPLSSVSSYVTLLVFPKCISNGKYHIILKLLCNNKLQREVLVRRPMYLEIWIIN